MKGLFIPDITAEMFRNGCLEGIEALMAEGEIYDIEYSPWIPVSERLPEKIGTYLVTLDYKEHGKGITTLWYHGKGIGWDLRVADVVVAWQPLPEPYKKGGAEE